MELFKKKKNILIRIEWSQKGSKLCISVSNIMVLEELKKEYMLFSRFLLHQMQFLVMLA